MFSGSPESSLTPTPEVIPGSGPFIHIFWDDPTFVAMTPIVRLCVHTILAHHPSTVIFHGTDSLDEAIQAGDLDREKVMRMLPQHRADLLRAWLLKQHGGIWLDCDYLCFYDVFGHILTACNNVDFAAVKHLSGWDNDILFAAPFSNRAADYWSRVIAKLIACDYAPPLTPHDPDNEREWGFIGAKLLAEMDNDKPLRDLGKDIISPYRVLAAFQLDAEYHGEVWPERAGYKGVMLVNNMSGKYFGHRKVGDILGDRTVAGAFVRAAVRCLPRGVER